MAGVALTITNTEPLCCVLSKDGLSKHHSESRQASQCRVVFKLEIPAARLTFSGLRVLFEKCACPEKIFTQPRVGCGCRGQFCLPCRSLGLCLLDPALINALCTSLEISVETKSTAKALPRRSRFKTSDSY